jgi:hypothetical protein
MKPPPEDRFLRQVATTIFLGLAALSALGVCFMPVASAILHEKYPLAFGGGNEAGTPWGITCLFLGFFLAVLTALFLCCAAEASTGSKETKE